MKLAAGTLRTRVRGRRERPADLVTNVINGAQQAAAPVRRKRRGGRRFPANGVTAAETARIRTMYRGGVLIKDITAAVGRSHSVVYQVTADLPRRLDKGLGPRALALYDQGQTIPAVAAELGLAYGRTWALIDRRLKRRGE